MKKTRFTLIELLAAIGLVSLLAALGFAGYSYAMNAAKRSATRSLVQRLAAGLQTVNSKHGALPPSYTTSTHTLANIGYVKIGITTDSDGKITEISFGDNKWLSSDSSQKILLKDFLAVADAEELKKDVKDGNLQDRWGTDIYYRYPGLVNTTSFDLISAGPDGKFGSGSGSSAPPTSSPAKNSYINATTGEWECDDIANF